MTSNPGVPWTLLTDLYELTMAQSYFHEGKLGQATFSLFARQLPSNRSYMVAAGLEDALQYLEDFRFSSSDIAYLGSVDLFDPAFLDHLRGFRFTGEVWAIPEGRLAFAQEPLVEITAPIPEAQIVESFLINQINFQSVIATKASRCVWAAQGRRIVDFSLRRTQGTDAGMKVARTAYMVGCDSTSNVLAGKQYGIPVAGTMAHSYVSSFPEEIDAFRAYARSFPESTILLIDTYDTVAGAHKAAAVAKEMEATGHRLRAVRLDSGDLVALSKEVRQVLDEAGLDYVGIFASGGLDEYQLAEILEAGAPIDGFGVGTRMGVSADAPYFDTAYKLVEYQGRPILKLSAGKVSLAGQKQVYRRSDSAGQFMEDIIALRDEPLAEAGEPLMQKVMENGRTILPLPGIVELRQRFKEEFARLPERYKALGQAPGYPVSLSPGLRVLQERVERQVSAAEIRY